MKSLPGRRGAVALIAVSFVFLALGTQPREHAFIAIGACFLIIGLGALRRSRRG